MNRIKERLDDHQRRSDSTLEPITLDDPRVSADFRTSPDVQRLMSEGFTPHWDSEAGEVKLIRRAKELKRVTVENCLQDSPGEVRRRTFRARMNHFPFN